MSALTDSLHNNGMHPSLQMSSSGELIDVIMASTYFEDHLRFYRDRPLFRVSVVEFSILLPIPSVVDVGAVTFACDKLSWFLKYSIQRSSFCCLLWIVYRFPSHTISLIEVRHSPVRLLIDTAAASISSVSFHDPSYGFLRLACSCRSLFCPLQFEGWPISSARFNYSREIQYFWWTSDLGPQVRSVAKRIARLIWFQCSSTLLFVGALRSCDGFCSSSLALMIIQLRQISHFNLCFVLLRMWAGVISSFEQNCANVSLLRPIWFNVTGQLQRHIVVWC